MADNPIITEGAVPYISPTPVVQIIDSVAQIRSRSGASTLPQAMSVKTLDALGDRIKRALERYEHGEADIIVES
jgi:hypothetical protein